MTAETNIVTTVRRTDVGEFTVTRERQTFPEAGGTPEITVLGEVAAPVRTWLTLVEVFQDMAGQPEVEIRTTSERG